MKSSNYNNSSKKSVLAIKNLKLSFDHYTQDTRLIIPVLGVGGRNAFNLNLIYNFESDGNVLTNFGNNLFLETYGTFTPSGEDYLFKRADNYSCLYKKTSQTKEINNCTYNLFKADNQKYLLYYSEENNEFRLVDKAGNQMIFDEYYDYATYVYDKQGNNIVGSFSIGAINYTNNLSDSIQFIINANKVKDINVIQDGTITAKTVLTYGTNDIVNKVQYYYRENGTDYLLEEYNLTIDNANKSGTIIETTTNIACIFNFNNTTKEMRVQTGVGLTETNKSLYSETILSKDYTYNSSNPDYKIFHYYCLNNGVTQLMYEVDSKGNISKKDFMSNGDLIYSSGIVSYDETLSGNMNYIDNGNFDDSLNYWSVLGSVTNQIDTSAVLTEVFGSDKLLMNPDSSITQRIGSDFKKNESIRISFFFKQETPDLQETYSIIASLVLKKGSNINKVAVIQVPRDYVLDNQYGFVCNDYVLDDHYDYIDLVINTELYDYVSIKNIKVSKNNKFNKYDYDSYYNLVDSKSKKENDYYYDENNNLIASFLNGNSYIETKYNEYNAPIEVKENSKKTRYNEYDSTYRSNILKIREYFNNQYLESKTGYTTNGEEISSKEDVNGATYNYDRDMVKNLLNSVTNYYSEVNSYNYNTKRMLIKNTITKNNDSSEVMTTYYDNGLLKTYYTNNLQYLYEYNLQGKLKKVSKVFGTNLVTLIQYVYDYEVDNTSYISDNIVEIIDESNVSTYLEYDVYNNIKKVTRGNFSITFTYDSLNRVIESIEKVGTNVSETISYSYDINNQLVKVISNDITYNYFYDENERLHSKKYLTYQENNSFGNINHNLYNCMKSIYDHEGSMYCLFEKEVNKDADGNYIQSINPNLKSKNKSFSNLTTLSNYYNNSYGYFELSNENINIHNIETSISDDVRISILLSFYVENNKYGTLFTYKMDANHYIYGKIRTNANVLDIYSRNTYGTVLLGSSQIKREKWNGLGLTISIVDNLLSANLVIDNNVNVLDDTDYLFNVSTFTPLVIYGGLASSSGIADFLDCKIANIFIYPNLILNTEEMKTMCNESAEYLNNCDSNLMNNDNVIMFTSYRHRNVSDLVEYPLNNTLMNYNEEKLSLLKEVPGKPMFKYNDNIKDFAFNASGHVLHKEISYRDFSMVCNAYFNESGTNNTIAYATSMGITIELLKNSSDLLVLKYNNQVINTAFTVTSKQWCQIGFAIESVMDSESIEVLSYNLKVLCNGESFETQVSVVEEFSSYDLYIGENSSSTTIMNGLINDLSVYSYYVSDTTISNKYNSNETIRYRKYNDFGQLIEDGIGKRSGLITKNTYEYSISNNRNLSMLSKATIGGVSRNITTDKKGNILSEGTNNFTYDYLNRLKTAYLDGVSYTYTYDIYGNLASKSDGTTTINFECNQDKVTEYLDKTITYDSYGRLTQCGETSLRWGHNNLLDIETENDIIEFSYNVYGQRTRKDINQTKSIAYYYEGDTLIKEDSGTDVLVYLYDEKNLLYGLIWNGVKYFYQKDVLGNISAILDSTGNSVVQYRYDPFGKILSVNGSLSSTLGSINPFRYKGYYYDIETQLYWVSSRYYSPELCRWISPDSIEYLDPESINGLNLYAYCNNDPVNKYDPTGHFGILTIIDIIIVVVALAATANDIYQISSGNVYVDMNKTNSENVHIENSYKILTPWMRYGYSFYLNHFNPNTKDVIQGSTAGVQFEWELHNYAAWLGIGGDSAKHLDVGKSIFADGKTHPLRDEYGNITATGAMSLGMRVVYIMFCNPIYWIWDLIVNGGF